ncbi:MAG TPA: protoporphyrinogen oxidase [Gemmatimonadales bacterium]|jgi:oxygen-dependent protoporphyrinogen oxidase|nr:protoporphyrinogen oxidase [Gemmatimonadales bacterium]
MSARRVVVVGGGIAGLVAARRLMELGCDPVLLEATSRVGGAIETVARDGWLAEAGSNTVMEPEPAVRALLERVGLGERILRPGPAVKRRYLVHDGAPVPVPLSPSELVSTPILSVAGRLRLLKEPFVARGDDDPDETVEAFARRRFGDEVATRLFDPLIAGTTGADPARVLVRYAFPRLVEYERTAGSILKGAMRSRSQARRRGEVLGGSLWTCLGGLGDVPAHLATALGTRVQLGRRVVRVATDGARFLLTSDVGAVEGADAVCFASPARAFADIDVAVPGGDALAATASIPHSSLASVSLGYRRRDVTHPLDGFGMLAPSCEQRRILGVLFPSSLFVGRAPEGHVLLTTFAGGMRNPEVSGLGDDDLVAVVRAELHALLGVSGEPVFRELRRWHDSHPLAVAGHAARMAPVQALEASQPRLAFAGCWHGGAGVHDVMLGGMRAAERLAASLA